MFKQRRHRTFNYQRRFSKENQVESNSDNKNDTRGFVSKWKAQRAIKSKAHSSKPLRILILILLLLLICMYFLDKKYM